MSADSFPTRDSTLSGLRELPDLVPLLGQIRQHLARAGQLGLLSVATLRRGPGDGGQYWVEYESMLAEIADFLRHFTGNRMRPSDLVLEPAVTGNTFLVLLGPPRDGRPFDRTNLTRVRHRLNRGIQARIELALPEAGEHYGVYVGAAMLRHEPGVDSERIVYRGLEESFADALVEQKKEGLNQAVHLQRILRHEQIRIVYQPLVDLAAQRVIGYEALTRLTNGQFSRPDLLFKVAHENGALWALERLCRRRALENLPPLDSDQKLFLNIEPDSFHDPELARRPFYEHLEAAGMRPDQLVLELTEHAAVSDFSEMRRVLKTIRKLGFHLAMDDVGSGYAGLQAIAEIKPDYLKVDMTLVRNLHRDRIKRELIETIRRFSDTTGTILVAEGVETLEELDSLARAGVRCAQGFLFARPGLPPDVPDWDRLVPSTLELQRSDE